MVVEIKRSDGPEEVRRKLNDFREKLRKEEEENDQERKKEIMKFFGSVKFDADPVEWQRKLRDEWD